MVSLTNAQMAPMLEQARTVAELDELVIERYGSEHVPEARLAAVRLYGAKWVFGMECATHSNVRPALRAFRRPSNTALLIGSLVGILVFLCPPYTVTLQPGLSVHVGFFSIFTDSGSSKHGAVNIALLALELIVVAVLTAVAFLLARRIESELK